MRRWRRRSRCAVLSGCPADGWSGVDVWAGPGRQARRRITCAMLDAVAVALRYVVLVGRKCKMSNECTFDSHIVIPHISLHTTASIPSSRRNGTSLLPPPSSPPRTAARPSSPRPRAKRSPPTDSRAASSSSPSPIFRTMSPSPGARSSSASRTSRDTTASSTSTAWT